MCLRTAAGRLADGLGTVRCLSRKRCLRGEMAPLRRKRASSATFFFTKAALTRTGMCRAVNGSVNRAAFMFKGVEGGGPAVATAWLASQFEEGREGGTAVGRRTERIVTEAGGVVFQRGVD